MLVLVLRHAERADEAGEAWDGRPDNPPLSVKGHAQVRATGAALAAAVATSTSTRTVVVSSPFQRCLQTAAGLVEGLGDDADIRLEVDPALGEIAGPPFIQGAPWDGCEPPGTWVWAGGSPAAALATAGLPPTTPIVSQAAWATPPESLEAGHARYDRAIAAAATRAAATAATSTSTLILVSHGEAVRRAVTRVLGAGACVYEVRHCGWVACEWTPGGEDGDGEGGEVDPGAWTLLPGRSAGVAWLES